MRWSSRLAVALATVVSQSLVACADDQRTIPSIDELSSALLTDDDLDGNWVVFDGPQGGDEKIDSSGILTEEQRDLVPSFDLCEKASVTARETAESLRPVLFRQLDLSFDDRIDPPSDRSGHQIFLQQFVYVDGDGRMNETFDSLRDGVLSCFGEIPAGEEGPGSARDLPIPEWGDERFGVLTTIEEAGGWAEWRIQKAVVRDGPVLIELVLVDIRAGVEPYFTADEFGRLVDAVMEKMAPLNGATSRDG